MCWRKQETFRHGYPGHMPMETPTAWFANTLESLMGRKRTVCSGGSAENNPSNIANKYFNQVGFMTIIIQIDLITRFLFPINLISHACDGWPKKGDKFRYSWTKSERQLLLLSLRKSNKENYCICFVSCKFFAFRVLLIETFTSLVQEEEPGKQTGFSWWSGQQLVKKILSHVR